MYKGELLVSGMFAMALCGCATSPSFNRRIDVAQGGRTRQLYVSEENNNRIRRTQP